MIIDPNFNQFIDKQRDSNQEQANSDDKSLTNISLLVSTGAFGLSITFFLNKSQQINCAEILIISWIFLASSIILNASGYYLARQRSEEHFEFLNKKAPASDPDVFTPEQYNKWLENERQRWKVKLLRFANFFSFIFFITGIISLTIFVSLNIS